MLCLQMDLHECFVITKEYLYIQYIVSAVIYLWFKYVLIAYVCDGAMYIQMLIS